MRNLSLSAMRSRVLQFTGLSSAKTVEVVTDLLNKEYEKIARQYRWPELTGYVNESLATVADQAYLAMPHDCAVPISIHDKSNDITLQWEDFSKQLRENLFWHDISGLPYRIAYLGFRATKRPLSAADTIRIQASSALGNEVKIRVTGTRSSPEIRQTDSIQTDTTSAVDGTVTFRTGWSIDSIGTALPLSQYVTIMETTTPANVLAHIPRGETQSQYIVLQFEQPPSTVNNLAIVYKKRVSRLVDDDDVPVLPDVSEAIVEAVIAKMKQFDRKYQQAEIHRRDATEDRAVLLSERNIQGPGVLNFRAEREWLDIGY